MLDKKWKDKGEKLSELKKLSKVWMKAIKIVKGLFFVIYLSRLFLSYVCLGTQKSYLEVKKVLRACIRTDAEMDVVQNKWGTFMTNVSI